MTIINNPVILLIVLTILLTSVLIGININSNAIPPRAYSVPVEAKHGIEFEDNAVESKIREILGVSPDVVITIDDMLKVTNFTWNFNWGDEDNQIKTLNDLQYCANLKVLDITNQNDVTDIIALKDLWQIEYINLYDCDVSDLSPLANHNELREIWLNGNPVEDISTVLKLPKLETLIATWGTKISDISALEGNNQLCSLYIGGTELSDVSVLKGMESLEHLSISDTKVDSEQLKSILPTLNLSSLNIEGIKTGDSIFSAIEHMTELSTLILNDTGITSIAPISKYIKLNDLRLVGNDIEDITPLETLTNITYCLDLRDNNIADISALKNFTHSVSLWLSGNDITDWSYVNHISKVDGRD